MLCVVLCAVWHAENLRVYVQNVPVCTGTTHTCVTTCGRGAGTHEDVLNGHTGAAGSSSILLTKFAHVELSHDPRGSPKKPLDVTRFQFDNRSRTTCSRFLKSFALPDLFDFSFATKTQV